MTRSPATARKAGAWFCLGIPPRIPPCGATGTNDNDAAKHTKQTTHATSSGATERGALAVLEHVQEGR